MNLELLEDQAWALLVKLNRIIDDKRKGNIAKSTPRRKKLIHARAKAHSRFLRRELKKTNAQ